MSQLKQCSACEDPFKWSDDVIAVNDEYYHKNCVELYPTGQFAMLDDEPLGETEINDGDFLLHIPMNVIGKVINGAVHWSDGFENDIEFTKILMTSGEVRHATPEEIAKEQERDWWGEHDRKLGEVRIDDVLYDIDANTVIEVSRNDILGDYMRRAYKVVCFAEDRKDMQA